MTRRGELGKIHPMMIIIKGKDAKEKRGKLKAIEWSTGFHRVPSGSTGFHRVPSGSIGFHRPGEFDIGLMELMAWKRSVYPCNGWCNNISVRRCGRSMIQLHRGDTFHIHISHLTLASNLKLPVLIILSTRRVYIYAMASRSGFKVDCQVDCQVVIDSMGHG